MVIPWHLRHRVITVLGLYVCVSVCLSVAMDTNSYISGLYVQVRCCTVSCGLLKICIVLKMFCSGEMALFACHGSIGSVAKLKIFLHYIGEIKCQVTLNLSYFFGGIGHSIATLIHSSIYIGRFSASCTKFPPISV